MGLSNFLLRLADDLIERGLENGKANSSIVPACACGGTGFRKVPRAVRIGMTFPLTCESLGKALNAGHNQLFVAQGYNRADPGGSSRRHITRQ